MEDCEEELEPEAYLTQDNPPRTATPKSLHEEPEIIRQVEKIRTEEVTIIEDADYDAVVYGTVRGVDSLSRGSRSAPGTTIWATREAGEQQGRVTVF